MSRFPKTAFLLFSLYYVLFVGTPTGVADNSTSGDLLSRISSTVPRSWTVELKNIRGKAFVVIKTDTMLVNGSKHGNADDGEWRQIQILIQILPKYDEAMMNRIRAHNAPIHKKLKGLEYYSREYHQTADKLLDEPMFHDERYGYGVSAASQIPGSESDQKVLRSVLEKISAGWHPYQSGGKDVMETLEDILLQ